MTAEEIFLEILKKREASGVIRSVNSLTPDYEQSKHDPWLLPDMDKAVERLIRAKKEKEKVVIYGDYDIDGLTATTLLQEAFFKFGIVVDTFIPNRFVEGYGLSSDAIRNLAEQNFDLIVTVDCGSLSHKEIDLAGELGMQVIVTDHHSVAETMPSAVATINPKRKDHNYPFIDLAGVGVAFKLVQAMQQKMEGLKPGQEKWFLDLVALGTVCDVVSLVDENRASVFWGLKVLSKTRRKGIRSLARATGIDLQNLNARHLGFVIGPHLNASGRLETAQHSLDLFLASTADRANDIAEKLCQMNIQRRANQDKIFEQAKLQAQEFVNEPVLVLSGKDWSHGIIGIVAAKILEEFKKPTFVLEEMLDGVAKGSARSFGDFSAVDAINFARPALERGGGHKLAAGVTLKIENIPKFRQLVNEFYASCNLKDQHNYLKPDPDINLDSFEGLNLSLLELMKKLEPFGNGNPEPIVKIRGAILKEARAVGKEGRHLKITAMDRNTNFLKGIGFGMGNLSGLVDKKIDLVVKIIENEWQGRRSAEGQVIEITEIN